MMNKYFNNLYCINFVSLITVLDYLRTDIKWYDNKNVINNNIVNFIINILLN